MMKNYSIEVLSQHIDIFLKSYSEFEYLLPKEKLKVFVPHINGMSYRKVLECCNILKTKGFYTVPHIAVRNLGTEDMPYIFRIFQEMDIKSVLLLGGDSKEAKNFSSVEDFLNKSNFISNSTVKNIYFGIFPDGHQFTTTKQTIKDLKKKVFLVQKYGCNTALVSQICFSDTNLLKYIELLNKNGINLSVKVTFIAPCKIKKIIKIARLFAFSNIFNFFKSVPLYKLLLNLNTYPDNFIMSVLKKRNIKNLHAYPFGNYRGAIKKIIEYDSTIS